MTWYGQDLLDAAFNLRAAEAFLLAKVVNRSGLEITGCREAHERFSTEICETVEYELRLTPCVLFVQIIGQLSHVCLNQPCKDWRCLSEARTYIHMRIFVDEHR